MEPNRIDQCVDTDEFLKRVTEFRQTWARVINGYAFVGNDTGYAAMIDTELLDKSKYKWDKGKLIPLTKA